MLKIKDNVIDFLKEYEKLCQKYNMGLKGCGCCGSPYLYIIHNNEDFDCIDDINFDEKKHIITINNKTIENLVEKVQE